MGPSYLAFRHPPSFPVLCFALNTSHRKRFIQNYIHLYTIQTFRYKIDLLCLPHQNTSKFSDTGPFLSLVLHCCIVVSQGYGYCTLLPSSFLILQQWGKYLSRPHLENNQTIFSPLLDCHLFVCTNFAILSIFRERDFLLLLTFAYLFIFILLTSPWCIQLVSVQMLLSNARRDVQSIQDP